jgi:hypothetical protein
LDYCKKHYVFKLPAQKVEILGKYVVEFDAVLPPQKVFHGLIRVDFLHDFAHQALIFLAPDHQIIDFVHFAQKVLHSEAFLDVDLPAGLAIRI